MTLHERITAFITLGKRLRTLAPAELEELAFRAENANSWFTFDQVNVALKGLGAMLDAESIWEWTGKYDLSDEPDPQKVGILMAGNIPAVGFHDLMCVLIAGHEAHVKLSSSDQVLIKWLVSQLDQIAPPLAEKVHFEEMLKGKDAYIATGSDNSARYFDYYFGKYPSIIRKNRTSIAVLDGHETEEDYRALANDIFQYFGLGCRNVSKIYIKDEEALQQFLKAIEGFHFVLSHHKYLNNYDYNKSIYLVNGDPHLDNGFLLCKQSGELVSPVAVLYYEEYADLASLQRELQDKESKIQCIVSRDAWYPSSVAFGEAQMPKVADYADRVDTLAFLQKLAR